MTTPTTLERSGLRWVLWSFVFCPCHLPLTLAVLAALLSGTAATALLREHVLLAGAIITLVWLGGTVRGFFLVLAAKRGVCAIPRRAHGSTAPTKAP